MIKLLQSPFVAMSAGGMTFLMSMFLMIQKPIAARAVAEQKQEAPAPGFWTQHNPEADQLLQELKKQKQFLDKREAELKELQTRLDAERAELNVVTQRVTQMQMEFDQNVIRIQEAETPNLKKLARMYSNMSPEGASTILHELDEQVVVKILSCMKEGESAPLLEAMAKQGEEQAKRAALISESLRKTFAEKPKKP